MKINNFIIVSCIAFGCAEDKGKLPLPVCEFQSAPEGKYVGEVKMKITKILYGALNTPTGSTTWESSYVDTFKVTSLGEKGKYAVSNVPRVEYLTTFPKRKYTIAAVESQRDKHQKCTQWLAYNFSDKMNFIVRNDSIYYSTHDIYKNGQDWSSFKAIKIK